MLCCSMCSAWPCCLTVLIVGVLVQVVLERQLARLAAYEQPLTLTKLQAPLSDADRQTIIVNNGCQGGAVRRVSALASPAGESGKTVVLVHGFKMTAVTWSPVWNMLRDKGHRVIAFDLPGHGESELCEGALAVESISEDIRRVLDHFEVEGAAIAGHSLGGFFALNYLLEHTEHSRRRTSLGFVCISCTAGNWRHFIGGTGGNWHGNLLMKSGLFDLLMQSDSIAALLMAKKFDKPSLPAVQVVINASRVGSSRRSLKRLSDLTWELNLHPRLSSLHLPSSIIVGSLDKHHPHPCMSEALRDDLRASGLLREYHVLQGVGHFIPLMRPAEAAATIDNMLVT
mmetsp:Transcript_133749/g.415995  ORF Transcript_133749/g.415995 Transcript_133749/m.415995 type:complete len:342 (+) Transcript_133749:30-1055(+)